MTALADLESLIALGESETLEFKRSTAELRRAGETLCAFLNGDGGQVLVGVGPKGQLVGQQVADITLRDNRVIEACRAWGIDAPTFKVEMGVTTVTFHAEIRPGREAEQAGTKPSQSTDLVGDSVGDSVDRLLGALERGPLATAQLQKALGLKHRPTFKENYLKPALAEGLIEMTVPDKPSSRLQKYRLTDAGRARLTTKRGGAP